MRPGTWDKRLLAVEKALGERDGRRSYPDLKRLNGLLQISAPSWFQERVKQVIEGVHERERLDAGLTSTGLRPDAQKVGPSELPLGPPEWFSRS